MDNYIWAIIIVIAILMAIVGYIADKTDFGRKEFERKVKKEKPKKEKIKTDTNVVEKLPINDEITAETEYTVDLNQMPMESNTIVDFNEPVTSDMNDVVYDSIDNNQVVNNFEETSMPEAELNQVEITKLDDTVSELNETDAVDQSLFEPLPSIDQVFSEPVPTEDVTSESPAEDDVWKF